jgi:erythromycin esterase-like protein
VAERKTVRPSLPASLEELFHESGLQEFLVRMDRDHPSEAAEALDCVRLHRAIGVIYRPEPNVTATTSTSGPPSSTTR